MKPTGVTSTSFRVWLATFIPSLAAAVTGFVQNSGGSKDAVLGASGIIAGLLSTLGKLGHDHGINKASIAAAGSDIAAQLPALKSDLSTAVGFVENELPGVKGVIDAIGSRVTSLEGKVPDLAGIESIVRTVLSQVLAPAPAPPAPPAA